MRIVLYVLLIVVGGLLGSKNILPKRLDNRLGSLQSLCLFFLLGVMGYKIGTTKEIFMNFHKIGMSALTISLFSIVFSIIFVKITCGRIAIGKKETKENGN